MGLGGVGWGWGGMGWGGVGGVGTPVPGVTLHCSARKHDTQEIIGYKKLWI